MEQGNVQGDMYTFIIAILSVRRLNVWYYR